MSKTVGHFHKLSHAHHDGAISEHTAAMEGEEKGSSRHAFHKAMIAHHEPLRDFHKNAMEKAVSDEMNKVDSSAPAYLEDAVKAVFLKMFGNTIVPTNVSGVAPTAPRAVPRPGQRELPATPDVPPEFQKLVVVNEQEEAS
jgi:hypothetical protein